MKKTELKETELINCLTNKERLQITRLIGHDSMSIIGKIARNLSSPDLARPHLKALLNIERTVAMLSRINKIYLCFNTCMEDSFMNESSTSSIKYFMNNLKDVYPGKLRTHVQDHNDFLACKPILYTVLSNLIKNSIYAQKDNPVVLLRTEYHKGFPEKALFIPKGARDYENFMAFHVQNSGKPISKNTPLINRLTKCPKEGKPGFGLYFTGLAARVLKAPINIKSDEKLTTVSFYHPIYIE